MTEEERHQLRHVPEYAKTIKTIPPKENKKESKVKTTRDFNQVG